MAFPGMKPGGRPNQPKPAGGGGGGGGNQRASAPAKNWMSQPIPKILNTMGIKPSAAGTPAAPAAPAGGGASGIPDIEAYLAGDQMYQSGMSELMKALDMFRAQAGHQRGTINSAFDTAMGRMGQERDRSLKTIEDDFASRGLVNSGLYGKARDDYNTEYNSRVGDLNTDRQNELNALGFEEQNFTGLNQSEGARLRQEAMARRAERYNIF